MLVEAISREKNVERDVVLGAVGVGPGPTKKLYQARWIFACRSIATAATTTFRRWLVVPDDAGLQNPDAEELLMDAKSASRTSRWANTSKRASSPCPSAASAPWPPSRSSCKRSATLSAKCCSTTSCRAAKDLHRHRQAHGQGRHHCRVRPRGRPPAPQRNDPEGKPAQWRPRARHDHGSGPDAAWRTIILSRSAPGS